MTNEIVTKDASSSKEDDYDDIPNTLLSIRKKWTNEGEVVDDFGTRIIKWSTPSGIFLEESNPDGTYQLEKLDTDETYNLTNFQL